MYFVKNVTFFKKVSQLKTNYFYNDGTRTTLGQLCTALWDSQSQPDMVQPGIEPGTILTPFSLRCSALDQIATLKAQALRLNVI